jgi:hypothetical protein
MLLFFWTFCSTVTSRRWMIAAAVGSSGQFSRMSGDPMDARTSAAPFASMFAMQAWAREVSSSRMIASRQSSAVPEGSEASVVFAVSSSPRLPQPGV